MNMTYDFASKEWIDIYKEALNGKYGEEWRKAAENWEGDFLFVINPDDRFPDTIYYYIDLWHGECREAKMFKNTDTVPEAEFQYIGKYSNWEKLLKGEIDPIRGLLMRKFKLVGNKGKLMRSTVAKELVETARKIDTSFV
jgi:putative sterol carrier protein